MDEQQNEEKMYHTFMPRNRRYMREKSGITLEG